MLNECYEVTTLSVGENPMLMCHVLVGYYGIITCMHVRKVSH